MKLNIKTHVYYKFQESFDYELITEGFGFKIVHEYFNDFITIYKK
jgi:hypothetical protein